MKTITICALVFALSLCGCVTHITADTATITVTADTKIKVHATPLP